MDLTSRQTLTASFRIQLDGLKASHDAHGDHDRYVSEKKDAMEIYKANLATIAARDMNADELLARAHQLAASNRAYVILDNGERGIIVNPGNHRGKVCVRKIDAAGKQSAAIELVAAAELTLQDPPAEPAPLRIAPQRRLSRLVPDMNQAPDAGMFRSLWRAQAAREAANTAANAMAQLAGLPPAPAVVPFMNGMPAPGQGWGD